MLIGAMNHPAEDVLSEIGWMADMGLEFIDLTLEPPAAYAGAVDCARIRAALQQHRMDVVGHTAFYLPMASPFEEIRRAAVQELRLCVDAFAAIGARWMNLHPDRHAPLHPRSFYIKKNILSVSELLPYAAERGVGLMIENLPGDFNNPEQLGELLDRIPDLGLHLDIGHANLLVPHNTTEAILNAWGPRLRHVHLHDNKGGGADLHLPLGAGSVDLPHSIRALKSCGYDGSITLEVFTPDREHFRYSRDKLRRHWNNGQ
jgi:sugar phosphate isomerase/epimerase